MDDVEAVPILADQLERRHQRERRSEPARGERSRADDQRRTLGPGEGFGHLLRQVAEQLQVIAEPLDLHPEVGFRTDRVDPAALARDLAHARGDERRLPADVRSDEQHRVGALDARDGRVECHRAQ